MQSTTGLPLRRLSRRALLTLAMLACIFAHLGSVLYDVLSAACSLFNSHRASAPRSSPNLSRIYPRLTPSVRSSEPLYRPRLCTSTSTNIRNIICPPPRARCTVPSAPYRPGVKGAARSGMCPRSPRDTRPSTTVAPRIHIAPKRTCNNSLKLAAVGAWQGGCATTTRRPPRLRPSILAATDPPCAARTTPTRRRRRRAPTGLRGRGTSRATPCTTSCGVYSRRPTMVRAPRVAAAATTW
ncbi:hypothetical protein K438DRAFT_1143552 [Mycena galopus ATCC 62051]|nr:hypothetical protein K438DRAFT_1143552 [Mycena galopus ATCC 62051]